MNKTDITTDNLDLLIRVFYGRVRKDDLIGPYFNATIQGEEVWEEHYKLLVDFWALNVLGISGFNGNPAKAHHSVDKSFKNSITTDHFDVITSYSIHYTKLYDALRKNEHHIPIVI